jgi:putative PIN family toxin of toxin-antitoxin system
VVRLVLDTNVVMDWLVFEDSSLALMRFGLLSGHLTILTHEVATSELRRVLSYPALKLDAARQADVFTRYQAQTSLTDVPLDVAGLPAGFPRCRDPDDDPFIALAWNARADALVSKDKAVLKVARKSRKFGFRILSVPQLNETLAQLTTS